MPATWKAEAEGSGVRDQCRQHTKALSEEEVEEDEEKEEEKEETEGGRGRGRREKKEEDEDEEQEEEGEGKERSYREDFENAEIMAHPHGQGSLPRMALLGGKG
jgi:hypothetical protein